MTIKSFVNEIKNEYNIDITKNIKYNKNNNILISDLNFNFFRIFALNLWESGLQNIEKFIPIGTSEDNNIYIIEKYYHHISEYYAIYNEMNNYIILRKN